MKLQVLIVVLALLAISACSSSDNKEKANGGYDYLESERRDIDLKIPEGLEVPRTSNRFDLPNLESKSETSIVGQKLKLSSPKLVLPIVSGSYVDEGSVSAKVNFDQIDDNKALDTSIWDKVLMYLENNNIGVSSFDRTSKTLVTDWVFIDDSDERSWYDFSEESSQEAKKFKLTLDVAAHGRTASLSNEIVDYIDESGKNGIKAMGPIERRNNEVEFLNYIIAEYEISVREAQSIRIAKIRRGFNSELGFNAKGDSAILVDAQYNDTWPRLLLVLRKMGFDVVDLDQSSGILFVLYNGNDEGFWSGLFSKDELALDKENYRIFVERAGQKTTITFKDEENVSFEALKTSEIFPVFKEYMGSEDLDI